jgi:hypothetical protein
LPPIQNLNLVSILIFFCHEYISGCSDLQRDAEEGFKFSREKLVLGQSPSEPDEERRSVLGEKGEKGLKVSAKVEASQRGEDGSCHAKQSVSSY